MAIATLAEYLTSIKNAVQYRCNRVAIAYTARSWNSSSVAGAFAPVAPSASHVLNLLANDRRAVTSKTAYLALAELSIGSGTLSVLMLYDRVWIQGQFSSFTTSPQTVNSPAVALTRYTDGIGLIPSLEFQNSPGGSPVIAISYTNQAGTSGRTSRNVYPTGGSGSGTAYLVTLADGDTGILSIESVTCSVAGSASNGNFNISLLKPLAMLPESIIGMGDPSPYRDYLFGGGMIPVPVDACLGVMAMASGSNIGTIALGLKFVET